MHSLEEQPTVLFGEILVASGVCSQTDVEQGLDIQEKVGGRLGSILLNMGAITEEHFLQALSSQLNVPLFREAADLSPVVPDSLEKSFLAETKTCLCTDRENNFVLVVADPLAVEHISRIELTVGRPLDLFLAGESELDGLLNALSESIDSFSTSSADVEFDNELDRLKELASEAPVIKLVNRIISRAVELQSSDIHFELFRKRPRVRLRVDGQLRTYETLPSSLQPAVAARLKLISGMNIAENRLPQDGRISLRVAGKEIDIRASSLPASFGESFVLRLLGKEDISYSLGSLGFFPDHVEMIRQLVQTPNGIYLTTGPTGSGKTTTLYSVLSELNKDDVKIITVEDPAEYDLEGISQIHVQEKINYTFANALRSILRQDPDIIMIGEIRDQETAEIAIQAALTGHLVLSTLHTNSALASVTRLLDMGIKDFLIKSTVTGLMAQRLVRKLCPHCAEPENRDDLLARFSLADLLQQHPHIRFEPKKAKGCENCHGSGFSGRSVIAEIIPFDEKVQRQLESGQWRDDPNMFGCRTMFEDGLLKVAAGTTSIDEVLQAAR